MNQKIKLTFLPLSTFRLKVLRARSFATKVRTSNEIRQQFLDFFIKENEHNFVKSSSIIPFCDSSLSFTNAGMNQVRQKFGLTNIFNDFIFSSRTFFLVVKIPSTKELRTRRNAFELEANTTIYLSLEPIHIITPSSKCLATGHSEITSRRKLVRWLGSCSQKFTKFPKIAFT